MPLLNRTKLVEKQSTCSTMLQLRVPKQQSYDPLLHEQVGKIEIRLLQYG